MPAVDLSYDGDANPWMPDNLLSIPMEEDFYVATKGALAWRKPAGADTGRRVIPSVHLESLLRHTRVPDPRVLDNLKFREKSSTLFA